MVSALIEASHWYGICRNQSFHRRGAVALYTVPAKHRDTRKLARHAWSGVVTRITECQCLWVAIAPM
jgi:hypothetical protein